MLQVPCVLERQGFDVETQDVLFACLAGPNPKNGAGIVPLFVGATSTAKSTIVDAFHTIRGAPRIGVACSGKTRSEIQPG